MSKPSLRLIVVKRWTTALLVVLTTVVIATITLSLSGKVYAKVDPIPFREIRLLKARLAEGPVSMPVVVALTMPAMLNVLLFMPWGFLMFIFLDIPDRPTHRSYLLTLLIAIAFSSVVEAIQYFLPTRVTDVTDVIWNGCGALFGALFGHLRKRVRVAFE